MSFGGGFIASALDKFCGDCKYYPGELQKCEKTKTCVQFFSSCYSVGWRISLKGQLMKNECVEINDRNSYFTVVQVDNDVMVVIAEPIFPFEPKEDQK